MGAVEMRGADRWPRTSPGSNKSCGYTNDCSHVGEFGDLTPPGQPSSTHWYSSVHVTLYVDEDDGHFGGGRARHECVYEGPNGKEGMARSLAGDAPYGIQNVHVTAIHRQNKTEAAALDPTQILTTHHLNWDQMNASGIDDSKLDWHRKVTNGPDADGLCICVSDPVGLPDFGGAFSNSTYLGRAQLVPQWQVPGQFGPPDNKSVLVDHYVKWNFHLFVGVDIQLPVMFSSPYGGMATYGNWSINENGPDKMWPEEINGGWRDHPSFCLNVLNESTCDPYGPPPGLPSFMTV